MEKTVIYTCPKCGNRMMEMGDSSYPGVKRYVCVGPKCGWVKYISNENYEFVPITELEKGPQSTDENGSKSGQK